MSLQLIMLALGIVLVIEGIGPLLFPNRWKAYLKDISNQNQQLLQRLGGGLVTSGIVLLIIFS
ncbi:DUF2065 domain-containing protein [Shewanella sp.]|uniref:DUF2065 domain-containing protein n=1 Tax=Shewanella sp. TaxID=50422 RepID=UPI001A3D1093|nr:DUF2065 domain-containing protein [Shewanella sp.]MBL4814395.1 DUF2065 domain-containing protein [Shewanella sp.]MCJ8302199.1 DUF2065 domain-containing protein [Shewanella sp.]